MNAPKTPYGPPKIIYPDSDIILRTKDGVDIHVHKQVLREASQTFRSMLSIPTPPDAVAEPLVLDDVSADILPLVQHLYGHSVFHLRFQLLDQVIALHKVAAKYTMEEVEIFLLKEIKGRLPITDDPVRAWALASHYGFEREKILAAQAFFKSDDRCAKQCMDLKELELVSGRQIGDLLSIRRRVHQQALALFIELYWDCPECDEIDESMADYDYLDDEDYPQSSRDVWRSLSEVKDGNIFGPPVMYPALMMLCATRSACTSCPERYGRDLERTTPGDLHATFLSKVQWRIPELKVCAVYWFYEFSED